MFYYVEQIGHTANTHTQMIPCPEINCSTRTPFAVGFNLFHQTVTKAVVCASMPANDDLAVWLNDYENSQMKCPIKIDKSSRVCPGPIQTIKHSIILFSLNGKAAERQNGFKSFLQSTRSSCQHSGVADRAMAAPRRRTHILPAIGWRGRFEFVSALSTARNCVAAAGIQFHLVLKKVQKTNQKEKIEEKKRVNEANDIAR